MDVALARKESWHLAWAFGPAKAETSSLFSIHLTQGILNARSSESAAIEAEEIWGLVVNAQLWEAGDAVSNPLRVKEA